MPKGVMITLLSLILIAGCQKTVTSSLPVPESSSNIIPTEIKVETPQKYYHPFDYDFKLDLYGFTQVRIEGIIYTINESYFEGLNELQVIYSNHNAVIDNNNRGYYYSDSKKITLYMQDESDEYIRSFLIHELKHHWCWVYQQELTTTHTEKCFMEAPLK